MENKKAAEAKIVFLRLRLDDVIGHHKGKDPKKNYTQKKNHA